MKKIVSLAGALAVALLSVGVAAAQAPEGMPEGAPDEAAIMREVGAPTVPTGEIGPGVIKPTVPGIPAEARAVISDADFIEVYCLTTKWKSGAFFSALDALDEFLTPAVTEASAVAGPFGVPDVASIRAEADRRLAAVCDATSVEAADAAATSLADYGESVRGQFSDLRSEMSAKLQAKGDELRARIESQVRAAADAEKAKAQAELNALGESLGAEAQSGLASEMSGKSFGSAEAAQAYVNGRMNSVKADITGKLQARANALKAEIETRLRTEAEAAAGADKSKFESLGAKLSGLGDRINAAIAAGEGRYATYRAQAQAKRKAMVLAIVDRNIEQAKSELGKNRVQIEEARAADSTIKSVDAILADLAADRSTLAAAMDAAFAKDDEVALQAAIDRFRDKWEGYRANVEQAFVSVPAICDKAAERLTEARGRLDAGFRDIEALQKRCEGSVDEECLRVNEFAPRFATLTDKMKEVSARLTAVEAACYDESAADVTALLGLLAQVKSAGEELETYGAAFDAEKVRVMADSASAICSQVLPQARAARTEIQNDGLADLEARLNRCRGDRSEECAAVNATSAEFAALKGEVTAFLADAAKLEANCGQATSEDKFLELRDLANYLKSRGETLKTLAKDLQAKQAEKASEQAVCAAIGPRLDTAKSEIAAGMVEATSALSGCQGKTDNRCAAITASAGRIGEIRTKAAATLGRIAAVAETCRQASAAAVGDALLSELAAIRDDEGVIKSMVAELKAEADSRWPDVIKSGRLFKVIFDVSPSLFDDSAWTGDWRTDQMGTIRGGETYTLTYGASGWAATGINEATGRVGTWTYRYGDPDAYQIDLWGRVYKFDAGGLVYDPDFGLVGHLAE